MKKNGGGIAGIPIVAPNEIIKYDAKTIIVSASFFDSIYNDIQKLLGDRFGEYKIIISSFLWLMLVNVRLDQELLDKGYSFICQYGTGLKTLYDMADKTTMEILNYVIRMRAAKKYFCEYADCKGMQYVEGYFYNDEIEEGIPKTIIDIGAFEGDTIEEFFGRWKNSISAYYAFEPLENNCKLLTEVLLNKDYKDKVHVIQKALGDGRKTLLFAKESSAFGVADDIEYDNLTEVEVDMLDHQEIEVQGSLIIKMDVEGAEMDILKGASALIRKYTPYMAICVYHRIDDIYTIPKYLNDIGCNYRYLLRSGVHTHLLAIPMKMT